MKESGFDTGELERCCECDEPTGKAGASDDSIYTSGGIGPFCDKCWDDGVLIEKQHDEIATLRRHLAESQARANGLSIAIENIHAVAMKRGDSKSTILGSRRELTEQQLRRSPLRGDALEDAIEKLHFREAVIAKNRALALAAKKETP